MSGLLEGIRVLDLSRILAGPWCGMTLGDLGADVVKVERPGSGDDTRHWGPPFTESGQSAYFLCANRNKRGITLDFGCDAGKELLGRLIASADVVIENFRAGTLAKWGFDWERLTNLRPDIVYCTITGFGYDNEFSREPGYDMLLQARGGLMSITGPEDGPPHKVGVALCDVVTGLNASNAILAALVARARKQSPQRIDISLFDSQVTMLANVASNYLVSGERPVSYGNAHPSIVPYQAFDASDGALAVGVGNDAQWSRLCAEIGEPGWATDVRFATNAARVESRHELIPLLATVFAGRSRLEWTEALERLSIPCAPIQHIDEVFADPRALARGLRQEVDGVPLTASPLRIPTSPVSVRRAPPKLGEHTREVLEDWLGFDQGAVERLVADGVV